MHEKELETIYNLHPLDYRYMEDYICEIEENSQIQTVHENMEIVPGISVLHTPAHTLGGLKVLVQTSVRIAAITGFCVIKENFEPPAAVKAMEMEVIPPGTHVNVIESYNLMLKVKALADILLPLHEPLFASIDTIG